MSTSYSRPIFSQKNRSLRAGDCLVSALAEELLASERPIQDACVIVPNQRLQVYLTRELLMRSHGVTLLPRMMTWDSFVDDLVSQYINPSSVMVSTQIELVMERVIEELTDRTLPTRKLHVNISQAHELAHLYSDLARAGILNEAPELLKAKLQDDWRRTPEIIDTLFQRIDDVFSLLSLFEAKLRSQGWATKAGLRAEAIQKWVAARAANDLEDELTGNTAKRHIIAGLTSLPKVELTLLSAINNLENVEIWLDETPPDSTHSPLAGLRLATNFPAGSSATQTWSQGVKSISVAPDVAHEVAGALEQAYSWIASGVPSHEIAIIVPEESIYGPAFAGLKRYFEDRCASDLSMVVKINMPLATSWSTTLPGHWLRLASDVAKDANLHSLGQYLLHPVTKILFRGDSCNFQVLQHKLRNFPESKFIKLSDFRDFSFRTFESTLATYVCDAVAWCLSSQADGELSPDDLEKKLREICQRSDLDEFKKQPKDKSAWQVMTDAVDQVILLSPFLKYSRNGWARFLSDVYRVATSHSVRETGEPLAGLQIIGLTEARYVPFTHAILVGCVEGAFPHGLPVDSLIDNSMRQAIGLPNWNDLEALEDTTFHLLTCRLPNVAISYSRTDKDLPLIRSRWIERLATRIKVQDVDIRACHRWLGCFKQTPALTPEIMTSEGKVEDFAELIATTSASRLRNLLWCPYRYLLEARGVTPVELPEDRARLKIGELMHRVLELFFSQQEITGLDSALTLQQCPTNRDAFIPWATLRLEAIAALTIPPSLGRSEDFQQMLGRGWSDVAKFWAQLLDAGFSIKSVQTEVSIGKDRTDSITIGDHTIKVRGSIDAVHRSPAAVVLVDYKTSTVPKGKRIEAGLEPQLPLYAKVYPGLSPEGSSTAINDLSNYATVYFNLKDGKASYAAVGADAKALLQASGALTKNARPLDLSKTVASVEERWSSRLRDIINTSRFEADPSGCDFCAFEGICRKDDPRYRASIANQATAEAE